MPASTAAPSVILGSPHPTLECALAEWLEVASRRGGATIVTPHQRLADHLPRRMGELGVEASRVVVQTLDQLAGDLAAPQLHRDGRRTLDPRHLSLLVSDLGLGVPALPEWRRDALTATAFAELRELLMPPDAFSRAARRCPELPHLEELAQCYQAFCQALTERRLADLAVVAEIVASRAHDPGRVAPIALYGFLAASPRQRALLRASSHGGSSILFLPCCDGPPSRALPSGELLARQLGAQSLGLPLARDTDSLPRIGRQVWADPWQETLESLRALLGAAPDAVVIIAASSPSRSRRALQLELATDCAAAPGEAPAVRALLALLRLAAVFRGGRMPRCDVEELLLSGALVVAEPTLRRWPQLLRHLGIVEKRGSYARLARGEVAGSRALPSHLRAELRPLGAFLGALLSTLDELSAPAESWEVALRRVQRAVGRHFQPTDEVRQMLVRIADLPGFDGVLRPPSGAVLRQVELLVASSTSGDSFAAWEESYGVTACRVIWPELVLGHRFRLPWVSGLFSEADRAALGDAFSSLGLPHRLPRQADFESAHVALAGLARDAARRELWLSRSRREASGRITVPAALWSELSSRPRADGEIVEAGHCWGLDGASSRAALLPFERDLVELGRFDGAPAVLARRFPDLPRSRRSERARESDRLTAWDGVVGATVGAALLARWRRDDGVFRLTASRLQAFGRCPFQFLLRHVLALERVDPPELALGPGSRELGVLAHELLAELFSELASRRVLPLRPASLDRALSIAEQLVRRREAEEEAGLREEPRALREARFRRLREALRRLLSLEAEEEPPRQLVATEVDLEDLAAGKSIATGRGAVTFSGRVDRLDRDGGGLLIVDYKTGRLPAERFAPGGEPGAGRQLAVYAALLRDRGEPVRGLIQGVSLTNGLVRWEWGTDELLDAQEELVSLLEELVDDVSAGFFPQVEHDRYCDHSCPFGEVCGPGRRRVVALKSKDPRHSAARRRGDG